MEQSHISEKNISGLKTLAASPNSQTAQLAGIILEAARVQPYKRHRLNVLATKRRDLLEKLRATGLIFADRYD